MLHPPVRHRTGFDVDSGPGARARDARWARCVARGGMRRLRGKGECEWGNGAGGTRGAEVRGWARQRKLLDGGVSYARNLGELSPRRKKSRTRRSGGFENFDMRIQAEVEK
jgi:hypothetical protein